MEISLLIRGLEKKPAFCDLSATISAEYDQDIPFFTWERLGQTGLNLIFVKINPALLFLFLESVTPPFVNLRHVRLYLLSAPASVAQSECMAH